MSASPTISAAPPGLSNLPGAAPNGPVPVPGAELPAFDNTLGALFIGSSLAMLLYGTICLQTFIYITGQRGREDRCWLRTFVTFVFVSTDSHPRTMICLIDFMNPFALPSGGPASGEVFFSWRIWTLSSASMKQHPRMALSILTTLLAFLTFGTSIDLAITGFNHRLLQVNTPDFILAYKLSASSRIVFDVFVTFALTLSLYRTKSGVKKTDHIIKLLILFTVNTNLITTYFFIPFGLNDVYLICDSLLSMAELATFLVLPKATIYGGIGFLGPKTYFNTVLASLNSRDWMRHKLDEHVFSSAQLPSSISAGESSSGPFSLNSLKRKNDPGAEDSLTFVTIQRPGAQSSPEESYEMSTSKKRGLSETDTEGAAV
ncbi:hypothetical protein NP233_g7738 [Leucocoprinus birnbaumii]|uniref:DUF6534 domain-containing protein n=1 Tax=Leucocoprinus birnbaumii TaxID=56174 RepID=A0AAD5VU49_9AGAR|nr:hypothetical protein NP233_g7738 [Leucocoprinus birnbaumii]